MMTREQLSKIVQNSKTIGDLLDKTKRKMPPGEFKIFEALFYASDPAAKSSKARRIDDLVCYGSVAYCCGLEKKCPFRNYYLSTKGVSPEFFVGCKAVLGKMFWELWNDVEKRKEIEERGRQALNKR